MLRSNDICKNHPNVTRLLESEVYERRRRTRGMSQYTLANKIGVTRNCIYKLECHGCIPKIETILDIIAALGFSMDERKAFFSKYLEAYYKDVMFQESLGREPAGVL